MIMDYFKNEYRGIKISYAVEETPLGTGGAILNSLKNSKEDFVYTLNGDMYTNYNLKYC